MEEQRFYFKDVLFIVLGSCIYAFGLVTFNIAKTTKIPITTRYQLAYNRGNVCLKFSHQLIRAEY